MAQGTKTPGTKPPTFSNVERTREQIQAPSLEDHFYVTLLGFTTFDAVKLHERVAAGFSYATLERLRRTLGLSLARFGELIWMAPRTLARRKASKRLQPEESDRLLRLSRIVGLSLLLFEGELAEARRWLLAPHPALGNELPLELASTEVGAREVERLIGRLEYGIPL